jgi:hypothetical protein
VSEKLQTLVAFDMSISRMKDFYDLWVMSRQFSFGGAVLTEAIRAMFERRRTTIPQGVPTALTDVFAGDHDKQTQWAAFLKRNVLTGTTVELATVIQGLRSFLFEPLQAAAQKEIFSKSWNNDGPWA